MGLGVCEDRGRPRAAQGRPLDGHLNSSQSDRSVTVPARAPVAAPYDRTFLLQVVQVVQVVEVVGLVQMVRVVRVARLIEHPDARSQGSTMTGFDDDDAGVGGGGSSSTGKTTQLDVLKALGVDVDALAKELADAGDLSGVELLEEDFAEEDSVEDVN